MSSLGWDRIARACEDIDRLPPAEREPALERLARASPDLAAEVRSLLAADRPLSMDGLASFLGNEWTSGEDGADPGLDVALPPIARIGRYHIEATLGSGGSATVYRARTEVPPRPVAVKLFHAPVQEGDGDRGASRRFDAEVRALSRLRHPGIATILDAGISRIEGIDRRWIAMELVDGGPITDRPDRPGGGPLDRRAIVGLVRDLARAVAHAHGRGIIHRDLKPANVLVERRDGAPVVRVLDFGVARLLEDEDEVHSRLTRGGQVIGTVGYLAPEQITGDPEAISTAVDVHAIGLILHELLGGRPAVDVPTGPLVARLQAVARGRPRPIREAVPDLDEDLAVIVDTATAREPADRYASAASLADDLAAYVEGRPIAARPLSTLATMWRFVKRHRVAATLALAAAVVLPTMLVVTSRSLSESRRNVARLEQTLIGALDIANEMADEMDRQFGASTYLDRYYERQLEQIQLVTPMIAAGLVVRDPLLLEVIDHHRLDGWERRGDVAIYRPGASELDGAVAATLRERYGDALIRFSSARTTAGAFEEALALRFLGLAIEREALADRPGDPEQRRQEAFAMIVLGDSLHHLEDVPRAKALYERALEVDRGLAAEFPDVRRHVDDIAWGLDRIAILVRLDDPGRARSLQAERQEVCRGLLKDLTPEDGRAWAHAMHGLAASHQFLANLAAEMGDEDPMPHLERMQAVAMPLVRRFPDDVEYTSIVHNGVWNHVVWAARRGHPPDGMLRQARAFRDIALELLAQGPEGPGDLMRVVHSTAYLALAHLYAGHEEDAQRVVETALERAGREPDRAARILGRVHEAARSLPPEMLADTEAEAFLATIVDALLARYHLLAASPTPSQADVAARRYAEVILAAEGRLEAIRSGA